MAETTSNPIGRFAFKDQTDASHAEAESKNFKNLASKLVQVPKTEIDEQRQKS